MNHRQSAALALTLALPLFTLSAQARVTRIVIDETRPVPAAEAGGVYPFFPFFTEANDAIGIELQQVMTAGKDPQEALNEAERKVNEVIARRASA